MEGGEGKKKEGKKEKKAEAFLERSCSESGCGGRCGTEAHDGQQSVCPAVRDWCVSQKLQDNRAYLMQKQMLQPLSAKVRNKSWTHFSVVKKKSQTTYILCMYLKNAPLLYWCLRLCFLLRSWALVSHLCAVYCRPQWRSTIRTFKTQHKQTKIAFIAFLSVFNRTVLQLVMLSSQSVFTGATF